MTQSTAIVVHATPFREIPGTRGRVAPVGVGDVQSTISDVENQLGAIQQLIDAARTANLDADTVSAADAAKGHIEADVTVIRQSAPIEVVSAPAASGFNTPSFLAGLGLALVASAVVYLSLENVAPPRRRRTA